MKSLIALRKKIDRLKRECKRLEEQIGRDLSHDAAALRERYGFRDNISLGRAIAKTPNTKAYIPRAYLPESVVAEIVRYLAEPKARATFAQDIGANILPKDLGA